MFIFLKILSGILRKKDIKVMVVSRDKDVVVELLNAYGIPHTVLSKVKPGKVSFA